MPLRLVILFVLLAATPGCASLGDKNEPGATTENDHGTESHDPFESYNRAIYRFNEGFDRTVAKPVAQAYQNVMPTWADKGISNFFSNLDDVLVLANNLLQLKFKQAASDAARIAFNTTAGLLGFVDVASHMDLPKHKEDFGQTLGYWGVPDGPYFVLPFLGPSTIRDTAGLGVDYTYFDPVVTHVDHINDRAGLFLLDFVDTRADYLGASRLLETAALDPYVYTREAYLQRRRYYIYDGDPPMDDFDEK
jgi:phospholipid-binding lipoprotein MlaA